MAPAKKVKETTEKVKVEKVVDSVTEAKTKATKEKVEKVNGSSVKDANAMINNFKLEVMEVVDNLQKNIVDKTAEFHSVKEAVEFKKSELKAVYDIAVEAETLDKLLIAQAQEKEEHESELAAKIADVEAQIQAKKEAFQLEQKQLIEMEKERKALLAKERSREQEEYSYNLDLSRKKDQDEYVEKAARLAKELEQRKADVEADLNARQRSIENSEEELKALRAEVESFPTRVDKEVKKAEAILSNVLKKEYETNAKLKEMEFANAIALRDQANATLSDKVSKLEKEIEALKAEAKDASSKVTEIASKAIDGASKSGQVVYMQQDPQNPKSR